MADIFTKDKRSEVMSRVRSRGNRDTELALIRVFRALGITGWRRHVSIREPRRKGRKPATPAARPFRVRPDFVFPALRLALFVDGCFWHACPLHTTKPKDNATFWRRKFAANVERDRRVNRILRRDGWRVVRIWEHALTRKYEKRLTGRLMRLFPAIKRPDRSPGLSGRDTRVR